MELRVRLRQRRMFELVSVGVFLLAVGAPLFGLFFCTPGRLDENRERYAFPPLAPKKYVLQDFPKHFEMYLGDAIGFRDVLLGWHRRFVFGALSQPVTAKVWIGKDGWLFVNQTDPFLGNPKKPSAGERVEQWAEAYAEREAWLKARGIDYIVVVAPDKAAVYPEFLRGYPSRHPPLEMGTSLAGQLNARGVKCLNLLPTLLAEKERNPNPVYFKTDSHWTHDGSRAAYRAVAEVIRARFPDFVPKLDSEYHSVEAPAWCDLRKLAGLVEAEERGTARFLEPRTPFQLQDTPDYFAKSPASDHLNLLPSTVTETPTATGPRLLFLGDSFGHHLLPFLQSDFRRAAVLNSYGLPPEAVRIERPKLVIQLLVARQLYSVIPYNSPEIKSEVRGR